MKLKKEWKVKMVTRTVLMLFMMAVLVFMPFKLDGDNFKVTSSLSYADENKDESGDTGEGDKDTPDSEDPDDPDDDADDDIDDDDADDDMDDDDADSEEDDANNPDVSQWQLNLEELDELEPVSEEEEKSLVGNWDLEEDDSKSSDKGAAPKK